MKNNMNLVILLGLSLFASAANANSIYCVAKFFDRDGVNGVFTADIESPTSLKNTKLKLDQDVIFTATTLTKDPSYKGSATYPDYINLNGVHQFDSDKYNIVKVLVPATFASQKTFQTIIAEKGNDGGSYNKFFCFHNN